MNVADDLLEFVLKVSGGFNREILEAIARIERFGLFVAARSSGCRHGRHGRSGHPERSRHRQAHSGSEDGLMVERFDPEKSPPPSCGALPMARAARSMT